MSYNWSKSVKFLWICDNRITDRISFLSSIMESKILTRTELERLLKQNHSSITFKQVQQTDRVSRWTFVFKKDYRWWRRRIRYIKRWLWKRKRKSILMQRLKRFLIEMKKRISTNLIRRKNSGIKSFLLFKKKKSLSDKISNIHQMMYSTVLFIFSSSP